MPQPAAPPAPAPTPTPAPAEAKAPEAPLSPMSPEFQIQRAKELEKRLSTVRRDINANRDLLRLMDANKALSKDQRAWLHNFYPLKERGSSRSADEIQATKDAKKEAREG